MDRRTTGTRMSAPGSDNSAVVTGGAANRIQSPKTVRIVVTWRPSSALRSSPHPGYRPRNAKPATHAAATLTGSARICIQNAKTSTSPARRSVALWARLMRRPRVGTARRCGVTSRWATRQSSAAPRVMGRFCTSSCIRLLFVRGGCHPSRQNRAMLPGQAPIGGKCAATPRVRTTRLRIGPRERVRLRTQPGHLTLVGNGTTKPTA